MFFNFYFINLNLWSSNMKSLNVKNCIHMIHKNLFSIMLKNSEIFSLYFQYSYIQKFIVINMLLYFSQESK